MMWVFESPSRQSQILIASSNEVSEAERGTLDPVNAAEFVNPKGQFAESLGIAHSHNSDGALCIDIAKAIQTYVRCKVLPAQFL